MLTLRSALTLAELSARTPRWHRMEAIGRLRVHFRGGKECDAREAPVDGGCCLEIPGMAWPLRSLIPLGLVVFGTACRPDEGESPKFRGGAPSREECEWETALASDDVRVSPCDVGFREVVRLKGDLDGVAPHEPIRALGDGRFLTGTYSPGQMALGAPDGELVRVMGRGPGEGPGEFDYPSGLVQTTEYEFVVFTGLQTARVYSTNGNFQRSLRIPATGGAGDGATYGNVVITAAPAAGGEQAFVLQDDSVRAFGVPSNRMLVLAANESTGVWSAEYDRYVLRRHLWPNGIVTDSIVRNPGWFPGSRENPGNLHGLHADGRGLIWVVISAADAGAPSGRVPFADDPEEQYDVDVRYLDRVIEVLTPDGRLVASVRYDNPRESANPIGRDLWYRRSDDLLPVMVILRAELTKRG